MFWCWDCSLNSSQIVSFKGEVPSQLKKKYNAKFAPNRTTQQKIMQIRCHKGTGTNKRLVGPLTSISR